MDSPTYWYHPESESLWIHNPQVDPPFEELSEDGRNMSVELSEYEYVRRQIEAIDADPEHTLPEGISGVIKLAYIHTGGIISGSLYYAGDKFPQGYMINTSAIKNREPGGVYEIQSGRKYLVQVIQPTEVSELYNG